MSDTTDNPVALHDAHALCLGFGIYKLMTDISHPGILDPTIESLEAHLSALQLEVQFEQRDFDNVQVDRGTSIQSKINAVLAGIREKWDVSTVAHFSMPVNTFLAVARPPVTSESFARISQSFSAISLPNELSDSFSTLKSLTLSADARQELLNWLDAVHVTYRTAIELRNDKANASLLDAVEIKLKLPGVTIDLKKLGALLAKRFTRDSS